MDTQRWDPYARVIFLGKAVLVIVESIPFLEQPVSRGFLAAFELASESVVITATRAGGERFLYVNRAFLLRTGYTEAELLGKSPRILQGANTNRAVLKSLVGALENEQCFVGQNTNYRKDGSEYIVRWYIAPLRDDTGEVAAWFSMQREVPPQPSPREEALFLSTALNQTADSVIVTDLKSDIVFVNAAFSQMTGYSESDVVGKNARMLQSGMQPPSFYERLWKTLLAGQPFRETFVNRRKDGRLFYEEATISPVFDNHGEPLYYFLIGRDVTELVEKTRTYEEEAYRDALTGLYNRRKLDAVLEQKLRAPETAWRPFSLVVIDIDDFKSINDGYGHDAGDRVLKELGRLLEANLRRDDLVARWGGEELVIVLESDAGRAAIVADKLRATLADHEFDPRFRITVSMGISESRRDDSADTLFKRADEAVYVSKQQGKNRVSVN